MKLINAKASPFGRKVAIALIEKGIAFETVFDEPWSDQTCTPQYNPLEQLPILIADDGEIAFESTFILEWIERRFPSPPLLPPNDDGILAAKRLQLLAEGVMMAAGSIVSELSRPVPGTAWIERQKRKVVGGIDAIERQVRGKDFAIGNRFGQADIGIGCNLSMLTFLAADLDLRIAEISWRENHPELAAYIDRLEARPSFRKTQPRSMAVDLTAVIG
ncbi:MAG TPA: glutathione S-transferase N-terminal domain-containing protein [Alphaproteobacteria bacterium]|nr:glutathione S-transferase N-terminal domain-containing protein [Alphaproteobacteria bacterium]